MDDALHHGRVLTAESYREMTTPVRGNYGYGLMTDAQRNHMRVYHNGSVPGFYSECEYFPGTDTVVVVLANENTIGGLTFTPGTHVIDSELMTLAAEPGAAVPSDHKEVLVSAAALRLLTGHYVSTDKTQAGFTIALVQDHLTFLQDGPHQPDVLHSDFGEVDFYLDGGESLLEFSGTNDAVIFDLRYEVALTFRRDVR